MLRRDTTFVLGAAFSAEMGMPLGDGLKAEIINVLPNGNGEGGSIVLRRLFIQRGGHDWFGASQLLRAALPYAASIDNLVEHHQGDIRLVEVAKLAIAYVIAKQEAASSIGADRRQNVVPITDLQRLESSAYHSLFRLIVGGVAKPHLELAFSRLRVVTFNYDRTLEVFLARALAGHSGVALPDAEEIVRQATIYHAYGVLDPDGRLVANRRDLTAVDRPEDVPVLAQGIRTFSEKVQSGESEGPRGLIGSAERLVFLGCAYHRQNLRLLEPERLAAREIYGTVYVPAPEDPSGNATLGIDVFSLPAARALEVEFRRWSEPGSPPDFNLHPLTCRQLIARHGVQWTE